MKKLILYWAFSVLYGAASAQVNERSENNTVPISKVEQQEENVSGTFRLATNDSFKWFDGQIDFKLSKLIYLGLSYNTSTNSEFKVSTLYPYLAARFSPLHTNRITFWANAGYAYSRSSEYSTSYGKIPSTSYSDFSWQIGAEYYLSNTFGITLYSPELDVLAFGIVFRGIKTK